MLVDINNKLVLFSDPRIIELFADNILITNSRRPLTKQFIASITNFDTIISAKCYNSAEISNDAFAEMKIDNIYAPNVVKIGNNAFLNCGNLKTIQLSNILYIGQNAFSNCNRIQDFDLTYLSDLTLHDGTFTNCKNITQLDGLYGLSVIGNHAIENCEKIQLRFMQFSNQNNSLELGENAIYGTNILDDEIDFDKISLSSIKSNTAGLFANNNNIKVAKINDKFVGSTRDMFSGCKNLQEFDSGNLTSLMPGICVNCEKLSSINCQNVRLIDGYIQNVEDNTIIPAFYNNPNLEYVNMPLLTNCAYFDNTKISSINFPYLKSIEPSKISGNISVFGFANCSAITQINSTDLPELSLIGNRAFANCENLTAINIGRKVEIIADDAFEDDAKHLKTINIADGNTRYSTTISGATTAKETSRAKYGKNFIYDKVEKRIKIGCSTTEINPSYSSVVEFNERISSIGDYAFQDCLDLGQTVKWNLNTLSSIGSHAFENNSNFKTNNVLTAKSEYSLLYIGDYAFNRTQGEQKDFNLSNIEYVGHGAFTNSNIVKSLYFPTNKQVTEIGISAFANCENITYISSLGTKEAKKRVNRIGEYAFYNTGIKKLKYYLGAGTDLSDPYDDTIVGKYAFASNHQLETVQVGYGAFLASHMFSDCEKLKTVTFDIAYHSFVDDYVFANCTSLKTINLKKTSDKGNIDFGINMFYNCKSLTSLTVPENAAIHMQASAFNKCENLNSITLKDNSITRIENLAFNECTALTSLTLNKQLSTFDSLDISALYGSSIISANFPGMTDDVFGTLIEPTILDVEPILSTVTTDFKYGMWYGWTEQSTKAAYQFATNNGIPVVGIYISRNGGSCGLCNSWWNNTWTKRNFQLGIKNRRAIFIVSQIGGKSGAYMAAIFGSGGTYPYMHLQDANGKRTYKTNINGIGYIEQLKLMNDYAIKSYIGEDKYRNGQETSFTPTTLESNNAWGIQHDCLFTIKNNHQYVWINNKKQFEKIIDY